MSSPTSSSFDHRPILATSSSFRTHMSPGGPSPSAATPTRRRVPSSSSNPSSPTTALSSASTAKGSSGGGGGGGFSPAFSTGAGGWSSFEKGKGREAGELEKQQQTGGGGRKPASPGMAVVIEDVLKTSNGRDKIFKLIQYTIKLYLYTRTLRKFKPSALDVRLLSTQKGLSLTRRCLLLLNPLSPLLHLLSPLESFTSLLPDTIDLIGGLSDDVYTLSRLGLVGPNAGAKADRWSNRFWLLTTLISLSHLSVSTPSLSRRIDSLEKHQQEMGLDHQGGDGGLGDELRRLRKQREEERWTAMKLWFDFVFVMFEIMHWKTFKEPIQIFAGLGAGLIGTSKLVVKHRAKLLKA